MLIISGILMIICGNVRKKERLFEDTCRNWSHEAEDTLDYQKISIHLVISWKILDPEFNIIHTVHFNSITQLLIHSGPTKTTDIAYILTFEFLICTTIC